MTRSAGGGWSLASAVDEANVANRDPARVRTILSMIDLGFQFFGYGPVRRDVRRAVRTMISNSTSRLRRAGVFREYGGDDGQDRSGFPLADLAEPSLRFLVPHLVSPDTVIEF